MVMCRSKPAFDPRDIFFYLVTSDELHSTYSVLMSLRETDQYYVLDPQLGESTAELLPEAKGVTSLTVFLLSLSVVRAP